MQRGGIFKTKKRPRRGVLRKSKKVGASHSSVIRTFRTVNCTFHSLPSHEVRARVYVCIRVFLCLVDMFHSSQNAISPSNRRSAAFCRLCECVSGSALCAHRRRSPLVSHALTRICIPLRKNICPYHNATNRYLFSLQCRGRQEASGRRRREERGGHESGGDPSPRGQEEGQGGGKGIVFTGMHPMCMCK